MPFPPAGSEDTGWLPPTRQTGAVVEGLARLAEAGLAHRGPTRSQHVDDTIVGYSPSQSSLPAPAGPGLGDEVEGARPRGS